MGKRYKVTFECYDQENPNEVLSKATVLEGSIEKPTNRLNFGSLILRVESAFSCL